jgi:hypothetical protein
MVSGPPVGEYFALVDSSAALLLKPFKFHLAMDTLPSRDQQEAAPDPPWLFPAFAFVPV